MRIKMCKAPVAVLLTIAYVLLTFAPLSSAQPTYTKGKALQKAQNENIRIDKYLEKGRKEREKHNYRGARSNGQAALRVNPNSREAKAFLDQLTIEEKRYADYLQAIKDRKEAEKRLKQEAKRKKKPEKVKKVEKVTPEEPKEAPKEEKKLTEKEIKEREDTVSEFIAESQKALEKEQYVRARTYAERALVLDKDNKEAQDLLNKINEISPPPKVEAPTKKARPDEETDLAGLSKSGKPIIVDGDKVEYFEESGNIIASGNVSITYGDTTLSCDRIEVNTRTRQALCEGNVRVEQPSGVLVGERIRYDFLNEEGEIVGGEVKAFPWFASAEETAKVGENEYRLRGGHFSTCDLDEPHYRLEAKQIQIFPDDKIIAKNVIAYIGKVPVFWMPYYYHPIIDLKAKVQFIPGAGEDWGYFLLSAWRTHLKGNSKVDWKLDYRSKKGFAAGGDVYYNLSDFGMDGLGYGLLRGYWANENGAGTYEPSGWTDRTESTSEKWRKRYQWNHRIDFDPRTVGILEFNKYSDEFVMKDYFYNEYEGENPTPNNFISIVNTQPNYTFTFLANKRFNDFYTVVQRLPELKVDIPNQRLWKTPLYYTSNMSGTMFKREFAHDLTPHQDVNRWDWFNKFSFVTGYGPVNLVPFAGIRQTVYSRTKGDTKMAYRAIFEGGLDVFMRFHKVYNIATDFAGLDIEGVRHIIVPKATYFHRADPNVYQGELWHMDEIDTLDKDNRISLSLENKLQIKRDYGGELKSTDFVRSIVSVDYLFRPEKNPFKFKNPGQFRDLKFDIEFRPYEWLYVDTRTEISPKNMAMYSSSIEATVSPWETLSSTIGYRYQKEIGDPRNQITFDLYYLLTPKWRVGIYGRYDLTKGEAEEQQLSIARDLHCWEVEATYDVDGSKFTEDYTFWLAFRIKAFPDLPIGLNRSFEKRSPGSDVGAMR